MRYDLVSLARKKKARKVVAHLSGRVKLLDPLTQMQTASTEIVPSSVTSKRSVEGLWESTSNSIDASNAALMRYRTF